MNIFQIMSTVLKNEDISEDLISQIPPFIFCRYLGSDPHCLSIANFLNLYYNIPINLQYYAAKSILKGKLKYIKYISTAKQDDKTLENLMKYYKISYNVAKQYLNFISKSELEKINKIYQE